MMWNMKHAINMHGPAEPNALLAWNAWPLTAEGKNPVTGGPLKMGKNPGEYWMDTKEIKGVKYLVFTVYGKDGWPIPDPLTRMTDKTTGMEYFDGWVGMVKLS